MDELQARIADGIDWDLVDDDTATRYYIGFLSPSNVAALCPAAVSPDAALLARRVLFAARYPWFYANT